MTTLALDALTPYVANPRRGDVELIAESLATLGQYRPIVVNAGTLTGRVNEVLAGNHTLAAARQLGWQTIEAHYVDVDDETAKRIVLVDNRSSDVADYDVASLVELLDELPDLTATGWRADDLDELRASLPSLSASVDDVLVNDEHEGPLVDVALPRPYSDDEIVRCAFDHYRHNGFPYPQMTRALMLHEVNALAQTATAKLASTATANGVASCFHPQRFSVPIRGKKTSLAAFERDDLLDYALRLVVSQGKPPTDNAFRSVLGYVRGVQLASNYRPGYALYLARAFAPVGGRWLDTSAGYGGRIVAFAASQLAEYVGIDPSSEQIEGNRSLASALNVDEIATLVHSPAEDVRVEQIGGAASFDFAFTSPPYFARERYSPNESTQSHNRYSSGEMWRDSFLLPTMRLQFAALKAGCVAVVNIADVRINSTSYPLVQWTIDCARRAGFVHESTELMPMGRVPGQGERRESSEPVLVFRKPVPV